MKEPEIVRKLRREGWLRVETDWGVVWQRDPDVESTPHVSPAENGLGG